MKLLIISALAAGVLAGPVQATEPQRPAFGLSNSIVETQLAPETRRRLERQAQSGAAEQSELSVQAYVDSQERIAETFRRPIPERIGEQTRDER